MHTEGPIEPVDQLGRAKVLRRRRGSALRRHAVIVSRSVAAVVVTAPFRVLPLDAASDLGGRIGRALGPHSRRHKVARENLRRVLPELSGAEVESILAEKWDNFGRTIAEYFHLDDFVRAARENDGRIEFRGVERLLQMHRQGRGAVFIGAHLGNWELMPLMLSHVGLKTAVVYRPLNDPYLDRLILRRRAMISPILVPKGPRGARDMLSVVRKGGSVFMVVDQKFSEGLPVPFFGRDAMTTTGHAKLALRYRMPVIPLRVERLGGARFRITACPPIAPPEADDRTDAARRLMASVNQVIEGWIRERPGQWQWGHRRWPD